MSIPREVHAVWVGGQPPVKEQRLLELNAKLFSGAGYKFKVWTESEIRDLLSNSPELISHMNHIYSIKKFAFLSDIVKTYILFNFGGWVIDADNEFHRSPEHLSGLNWVSGFECFQGRYHPVTAVMGAVKKHKFSKLLLDTYINNPSDAIVMHTNTSWISNYLLEKAGNKDNKRFYCEYFDVDIFPSDFFCGPQVTQNTVAQHHFSGSWL